MTKKLLLTILFCLLAGSGFCAEELTAKRTYNQKVFDLGGGKKNYKIHIAQIHYKDGADFKDIDTTLSQDLTTKQWKQSKASYQCKIPEYSNDWFEFYNNYEGANHTIKAKPVAEHIKGEYFKADDGNGVIYKDAFGKGIDLKVYAYWAGLKKVIIINEKPKDTSKDLTFDFELDLPKTKIAEISIASVKVKDRAGNAWDKSAKLDFKDKTLKIGEDGKESYFRNARIWDSDKLRQPVNIELFVKDSKTYLRKTITSDILEKAIYPLYTDHPTSYYPGAGDGYVSNSSTSWDSAHDSLTGVADYTGDFGDVYANYATVPSTSFLIDRAFFPVLTSGIDDGASITAALLYLFVPDGFVLNGDNDGDDWVNVVGETSQANTASLTAEDFDQCGAVDNPTEGATRVDLGSISTSAYNSWTLNATGRGWISKTGITKLGLREGHDCIDSPIAVNTDNAMGFSTSEDTSGTQDPYLDVTTEVATTGYGQLIMIND